MESMEACTLRGYSVRPGLHSKGLHSGGLESRATDVGSGHALRAGLHFGGLESRVTDFGCGHALTAGLHSRGATFWRSTLCGATH